MTNAKTLASTISNMLTARKDMEIPALLGDKSGNIKADANSNVYVTFWNGETMTVRNQSVPNQRHWVIVGWRNNILQVLRSWDVFYDASFPDVPEHDHTWGTSTNPSWIRKEQIFDGLAVPGTGLTVEFFGYWFTLSGVHHAIANQTIDLSAEIPASGAQWCNVEADADSVITFNAGTNKAIKELLLPEDIPATDADKRLLFSVKTYYGQTEFAKSFADNDFFDPRFAGIADGGGGAPATTAANDFQVGDGAGAWIKKTLAQTKTILGIFADAASDSVYYVRRNAAWTNAKTYFDTLYASLSHTHAVSGREVLSAARTYYVRTDGSDSNNGLANTAGGGFLTIQKAIDIACGLDLSVYDVTIQIADGTYSSSVILLKKATGSGTIIIQGNSGTPANVVISSSTHGFQTVGVGVTYTIKDLKITATAGYYNIYAFSGSAIKYGNVEFPANTGGYHIFIQSNASVTCISNYTISGGCVAHAACLSGGQWYLQGPLTITITGTPAFTAYAIATDLGYVLSYSITFSGSATGQRYLSTSNGVMQTYGSGANYFPGNSAGSTATGGQYV